MTDSENRFVVVLCSHNGVHYIEDQILSILKQGDRIAQVYVHDYASADGTRAVLSRLQQAHRDTVTIAFHDDAPGSSQSFIRALSLVVTRLDDNTLVFLADQDDVWLPEKLRDVEEALVERAIASNIPFVMFHDVKVVDATLKEMRPTYYTGNPFQVPRDLDFDRLLLANPAIGHTMLLSVPLIRLLVAWPDTNRYMMHDWLAALIASRFGKIEFIPQALSLYRQHDANVLGAYRKRRISPSRLLRFTDNLVDQAGALSSASQDMRSRIGSATSRTSWLERLCRHNYRVRALVLAAAAVARGPTWQRKGIGALLLVRAALGPSTKPTRTQP